MATDSGLRLVTAVVGLLRPQFCAHAAPTLTLGLAPGGIRLGSEFAFVNFATAQGLPYTQILSVPFPVSGLIHFVAFRNFLLLVRGQILDLGAFPCHS
ncbi:hypothetical protein B0H14DRAFT_2834053, partial [Mycena olivaceomarginata]